MGEGVALRGLRPLWRLRRPPNIGSSCDVLELRAPSHARLLARSGAAASGGASGASQRGLRPHFGAAESGFIGRRRRLGRALYP